MGVNENTANGLLQMESYRLAQYAVPVNCYICGGGNNFDAELCRHCQAPMALAHQVSSQKIEPKMVAAIGSAAAGKTVYLGMLTDMLSRQHRDLKLLQRGAISVGLQQTTMASLANNRFPDKTPNEPDRWNWVHCQVRSAKRKRPIELIIPDLSGEAILEEIDHPYSYPVIRSFLEKCSSMMVLIDAARIQDGDQHQDFFGMKMVSYLCELDNDPKRGWPSRNVAFVFTKADRCDACFDDPNAYAKSHTAGLWQMCNERLQKFEFFAAGVAGACAERREFGGKTQVPLRVEPHGVIEPFSWLVEQMPS